MCLQFFVPCTTLTYHRRIMRMPKAQHILLLVLGAAALAGAKELTPELKRDLQIIRMRGVLDPKRFYRSSDMKKELPKYFQVGTLIDGPEGSSGKKSKGSMLQEVMGDAKVRKRTKDQFGKIQALKALSARTPRKGGARTAKGVSKGGRAKKR